MEDSQVLKKLNFPAYCVKVLDNGLIALSGGGGTAKTGVENWLELGKIDYDTEFNAKFTTIYNFSTNDAIMKFISFQYYNEIDNLTPSMSPSSSSTTSTTVSSTSTSSKAANKPHDTYIVAAVGNSVEVYKLIPTIEKTQQDASTRTQSSNESSRERKKSQSTDNNNTSASAANANSNGTLNNNQQHQSLRKRHNSKSTDVTSGNGNKTEDVKKATGANKNGFNLKASARIKSILRITLDEIIEDTNKKKPQQGQQQLQSQTIDITALAVSHQQGKKLKTNLNHHHQSVDKILLFIGCTNGSIVIYNVFQKSKLHEIKNAHTKEIDDLQVNLSSKNQEHILSIGKDGKSYVWSTHNFEKIKELEFLKLSKNNLRMRHARFSTNSHLYTTYIPMIRNKTPKSYIVKWNAQEYRVEKTHAINNTIITAFQCNKDGKYICYGDYEGQIELLNENFVHLAKFKKQHSIVVTDLAFYHDSIKPYDSNKLVLSLSIDRTLQCYKYLNIKSYDSFKIAATAAALVIGCSGIFHYISYYSTG